MNTMDHNNVGSIVKKLLFKIIITNINLKKLVIDKFSCKLKSKILKLWEYVYGRRQARK